MHIKSSTFVSPLVNLASTCENYINSTMHLLITPHFESASSISWEAGLFSYVMNTFILVAAMVNFLVSCLLQYLRVSLILNRLTCCCLCTIRETWIVWVFPKSSYIRTLSQVHRLLLSIQWIFPAQRHKSSSSQIEYPDFNRFLCSTRTFS